MTDRLHAIDVARQVAMRLSAGFFGALMTFGAAQGASESTKVELPKVTVYKSPEAGIFSNAYLVETSQHVVAIDATLLESTSKALRSKVEELHKPLAAVLITHGHPDHYNGVTNLLDGKQINVVSTRAVDRVIREYDAAKEKQWRPVFGAEWPAKRTFPNRTVDDGGSIVVDGVKFTVHDLGPGESHADSYWMVQAGGRRIAFIGDVVLDHVHAYLTDGHSRHWLENIAHLRRALRRVESIYPGHGDADGLALLDWERGYLEKYRTEVASLAHGSVTLSEDDKKVLVQKMKEYLPTNRLEFLIPLGADPIAAELKSEMP
jgi:glyoxylase-like metal-dependent hydrolase (beta-lactamase superfamily II)